MSPRKRNPITFCAWAIVVVASLSGNSSWADDPWLVLQGKAGLGRGKQIVLISGDEEVAEAASPVEAAEAQLSDQPLELDDSDVGAGVSTGVWVTGLLVVVLLLLAFFAL